MRVLYFTDNLTGVSTNLSMQAAVQMLRPRGLQPVVVTNSPGGPFLRWLRDEGVPTYQCELPRPSKRWPFPFLASLVRLWRIARRHGCDLVHCNEHNIYPSVGPFARLAGYPVLCGVRFTMEPNFCRYAFGGRRRPDRLLFVSRGNLEACRPGVEGVVPEPTWRVLYNGTRLDQYRPDPEAGARFRQQHGLPPGVLVGAASALRPVKQIEHLIEAVARLPDPTIPFVLAGGPVPEHQAYAADLLTLGRARLGNRFISLGHVTDMPGFLGAIDLFVNASQAEGCSNSVAQALSCGVPVISYPSTSVDEQVLPDGGAIVEQDSVDQFAAELARWVGQPELRERGRVGARERAKTFDLRAITEQLWAEYQSVVNGRSAASKVT
jgi:glycosyltransferase involved in cell wall biosynthesis